MLETLVTWRSNPIVHRLIFASMSQGEDEPIQSYLVRLRATALDCNYMCPACEHDISDMYIKDQLIKGVPSDTLQPDLLAKAGVLKTLEQNVSHAEAFESAVRDQMSMSSTPDIAWVSTYRRRKRQLKCPAWGQTCNYCGKANHFSGVLSKKKNMRATTKSSETNEGSMDTLIAHITFNQTTGTYTYETG